MPGKNLRLVGGKPLICHTIDAARASRQLTHLAVSTDSEDITALAREAGVEVCVRPTELAADDTPMQPVIEQAVGVWERAHGAQADIIVLLQPTSPLRTAEDIDAAMALLTPQVDAVASAYALPKKYHPQRIKWLVSGLLVPYEAGAPSDAPRQQLSDIHKLNGAIYVMWRKTVMGQRCVLGRRTAAYLMPAERSVDIDDEQDLLLAEALLARRAPARSAFRALADTGRSRGADR